MLRPKYLFSFNGKRKNDFICDFVFWDIHLLVFWVQRVEADVLNEGDVVTGMPVQAVPQLGEGDAVHQGVDGADHLDDQDSQDDQDDGDYLCCTGGRQGSRDEVILDINNYQGWFRLNNLDMQSLFGLKSFN